MVIHSNPISNFTVLPNEAIRDKRLKLTDVGLLSYMLSLPTDWKFSIRGLAAEIPNDGEGAIRNSLERLERAGYVQRKRTRSADGKLSVVQWTVRDLPCVNIPHMESSHVDESHVANGRETKEILNKEQTEQKQYSLSHKRFAPPTVEQVREYAAKHGLSLDAEKFIAYYEANGWKVGKNPMKSWTAAARYWQRNNVKNSNTQTEYHFGGDYSL